MSVEKKSSGQSQDIDRLVDAGQKARQHIPLHKAGYDGREVEIYKLRGRIGEELAQEEINGVNLNDITGKSNFANYDLVSNEHLSSVKVKGLAENGEPRYSDYDKYFKDIVNPNSPANQRAASDLMTAKQDNPEISKSLPSEVAKAANQNEMAEAMADTSILQIPFDQVDQTRDNIYKRVINSPGDYGLDDNLAQADIESTARSLVDSRIQAIAKGQYSSHDIGKVAVDLYEQGHTVQNENMQNETPKDKPNNKLTDNSLKNRQPVYTDSESEGEEGNYDYYQGYGY